MKYYTVTEASKLMGITRQHLYTLCKQGEVRGAIQVGRGWAIPESTVAKHQKTEHKGLSISEVMQITGLSRQAIHKKIQSGEITAEDEVIYNRKRYWIREKDFYNWWEYRQEHKK